MVRRLATWRLGECQRRRCGATSGLLVVWHVRPPVLSEKVAWPGVEAVTYGVAFCAARGRCVERSEKRQLRARQRASMLVLELPSAPDAPAGTCRWCGKEIRREDGELDRRRSYHAGPESWRYGRTPREGEPDCLVAWNRSRTWDARHALSRVGGEQLTCGECGVECGGPGQPSWEADHKLALEDGGEHALENLWVLCVPCHREKTAQEARDRAAWAWSSQFL